MKGWRKLLFGLVGLLFLAGGLVLCLYHAAAGAVLYVPFAAGVVGVVGAVVAGNVGEHFATNKALTPAALSRAELERRVSATLQEKA